MKPINCVSKTPVGGDNNVWVILSLTHLLWELIGVKFFKQKFCNSNISIHHLELSKN